jgi:nitrogenase subunit NifH
MQNIKTITKTTTTKTKSVHVDVLYAVIENCFNNLQVLESDCTAANYFCASANIFAQLQVLYANTAYNNDYVSLESIMDVFANNITYYDERSLYEFVVENTALQKVKLENYASLSN